MSFFPFFGLVQGADRRTTTMPSHEAVEAIYASIELPALPNMASKIRALCLDRTVGAQEVGEALAMEPALAARVLRIANSAHYNVSQGVATIGRAINLLGLRELRSQALAIFAVDSFSRISSDLIDMPSFWAHSLYTGVAARRLSRLSEVGEPEILFVAGLLHDVGCLVLFNQAPDAMEPLLLEAHDDEDGLERAERALFGFSHADLGSMLLATWNLPHDLCQALDHHHDLLIAGQVDGEADLIFLADHLANRSVRGRFFSSIRLDGVGSKRDDFDKVLPDELGDEATLIAEIDQEFARMLNLFKD